MSHVLVSQVMENTSVLDHAIIPFPQGTKRSRFSSHSPGQQRNVRPRPISTSPAQTSPALHNVAPLPQAAASGPGHLDSKNTRYFPTELRFKIWVCALPDPAVIITGHEDPITVLRDLRPNLLPVCRESKEEAFKHYELFRGMKATNHHLPSPVSGKLYIYIDFKRDDI